MSDEECRCGEPPFTDGSQCPACLHILIDEKQRQFDAGEIDAVKFLVDIVAASLPTHTDEGEDE